MPLTDQSAVIMPGWKRGLNNVERETALKNSALRVAQNVDFDTVGKPSRRAGYTSVFSGAAHSVWASDFNLFVVLNGTLTAYDDNLIGKPLVDGFGPFEYLTYAYANGYTYWSSAGRNGRIDPALNAGPFAVDAPGTPVVAPYASGALAIGTYQVSLTSFDADGMESGSVSSASLTLTVPGQGILVTGIEAPPGAVSVRVYLTQTNGDVAYSLATLPAGTTSFVCGEAQLGRPLETSFFFPMPPGQLLMEHAGRMYCASGSTLWYSEPFRYGYTHHFNYMRFSAPITLLHSVGDADTATLFIAAGERTYAMLGTDPKAVQRRVVRTAGAVWGTSLLVPQSLFSTGDPEAPIQDGPAVYWMGDDGIPCYGAPGGTVTLLTVGRALGSTAADRGATMMREVNSVTQLVSSLHGGNANGLVATDSAVATVYKQNSVPAGM